MILSLTFSLNTRHMSLEGFNTVFCHLKHFKALFEKDEETEGDGPSTDPPITSITAGSGLYGSQELNLRLRVSDSQPSP